VAVEVLDEYGLDSSGELLHYRSHYTLHPKPDSTTDFGVASGNVKYLVKLLRRNCVYIRKILISLRNIVDHAHNNNINISDD